MRSRVLGSIAAVTIVALGLLAGCKDSPTSPGIQPEVVNSVDHFSYQISGMQNFTGSMSYSWQNTGTQATINQACAVGGGAATLFVLDGNGTEVYSRGLQENGTFTTAAGVAGSWRIRVQYDGTSATVNFRADKTT